MYKKILSLSLTNKDNDTAYHGEIYEEIIDDDTSKFTLLIEKYINGCATVPIILTDKSIKESNMEIASDITIIKSNHKTSFITNDMHDILNDTENEYNYFEIVGLYTPKKFRGNKYGQTLLNLMIRYIKDNYINPVIYTYAGASIREYPKEPTGDKLKTIIEKVTSFYKKNGFVSLNDFSNFENGESMVYVGDTAIVEILNHYKSMIDEHRAQPELPYNKTIVPPSTIFDKVKECINSFYGKIISPKTAQYEIEYNLNVGMCKVIEAKNDEDAIIVAEEELTNMGIDEQIERFLATSSYGGFKVSSINKLFPHADI